MRYSETLNHSAPHDSLRVLMRHPLLGVFEQPAVSQIEVMPAARKLWQPIRLRSSAFWAHNYAARTLIERDVESLKASTARC
jgi:hypothetical protein